MRRNSYFPCCPSLYSVHSDLQSDSLDQIWKIIPNETPLIIKKCPRCEGDRFVSSDKFRVNANKKIIDAWLIYKCTGCEYTHKRTLISRKLVSKIDRVLYQQLLDNHVDLAKQCAFNVIFPEQNLSLDWNISFSVQIRQPTENTKREMTALSPDELSLSRDALSSLSGLITQNRHRFSILIETEGMNLRLPIYAVLKEKLQMSRSQLDKYEKSSELMVYNLNADTIHLKNNVATGCFVQISREIVVPPSITLCMETQFVTNL